MTNAAMKGASSDEKVPGFRGHFVEIDATTAGTLPLVRIDGPYGAPAEDVFDVEVAILIGAGIGQLGTSPNSSVFANCVDQ
jgi:NADPH oxidase